MAADTITKLDTSDWGSGWVALRDVAWSPYDPYIFATTGNVGGMQAFTAHHLTKSLVRTPVSKFGTSVKLESHFERIDCGPHGDCLYIGLMSVPFTSLEIKAQSIATIYLLEASKLSIHIHKRTLLFGT